MTVADLIAELQKYPPGMRVLQHGNPEGGGYDDVYGVNAVQVLLGRREHWGGEHKDAYASVIDNESEGVEPATCVVVG